MKRAADKKPLLIVIGGPTGSGKSSLAVALARSAELPPVEIISADSRQIYRHMDIGTDKVSREIQAEIPHHMLDIIDPDQQYSAGTFVKEADAIIRDITRRGSLPVVAGGTGLYIRVLTGGLAALDGPDPERRAYYRQILDRKGSEALYELLRSRDPARAESLEPVDSFRVIRALEILDSGADNIQSIYESHNFAEEPYHCLKLILTMDRETLYKRIDRRVDEMVSLGLLDEVRQLRQHYPDSAPGMNAIGYRQMIQFLNQEISMDEAVRIIKRNSRRYAKRQLTWFRKESAVQWVESDPSNPDALIADVTRQVRRFYEGWADDTR